MSTTRTAWFESFSSQVADDGEPNTALDIAGQAVRDFNHRTIDRMDVDDAARPGWQFAPDAYRALGELSYLAGGLPQAFGQIGRALRDQIERDLIVMDRGSRFDGNPAAAVELATVALEQAVLAAHEMHRAIAEAQTAINAAAYNGPDLDQDPSA